MAIQTATNPETGERVALINGQWVPISQSATSESGQKAYLVNNQWMSDTAPAKEEPGFFSNLYELAVEGGKQTLAAAKLTPEVASGEVGPDTAKLLAERLGAKPTVQPKELQEVKGAFKDEAKEISEAEGLGTLAPIAKGFLELGRQILTNPKGVAYMTAEQAANMAPGILGMMAGAKTGAIAGSAVGPMGAGVGSVVGGVTGGFAGQVPVEAGSEFIGRVGEELASRGMEPNEANIAALLQDKKFVEQAVSDARTKGATTAAIDAVTTLIGGRYATGAKRAAAKAAQAELGAGADATKIAARADEILKARTLPQKAGRIAGGVGIDVLGGGASEAGGQLAAYGEVDPEDVFLEMLGEVGGAGIEIPAAGYDYAKTGLRDQAKKEAARIISEEEKIEPTFKAPEAPKAPVVDEDIVALERQAGMASLPVTEAEIKQVVEKLDREEPAPVFEPVGAPKAPEIPVAAPVAQPVAETPLEKYNRLAGYRQKISTAYRNQEITNEEFENYAKQLSQAKTQAEAGVELSDNKKELLRIADELEKLGEKGRAQGVRMHTEPLAQELSPARMKDMLALLEDSKAKTVGPQRKTVSVDNYFTEYPKELATVQGLRAKSSPAVRKAMQRADDLFTKADQAMAAQNLSPDQIARQKNAVPKFFVDMSSVLSESAGSIGRLSKGVEAVQKGYKRAEPKRIPTDLASLNQSLDKLEAMLAEEPQLPPIYEEMAGQPAPVAPEVEEMGAKIRDIETDMRVIQRRGGNLFKALTNRLPDSEISELGGQSRKVKENPFVKLRAKRGEKPADLSSLVADGALDNFLPPIMRSDSPQFDEGESTNHIREKLMSGQYYSFDAEQEIKRMGYAIEDIEQAIQELMADDEINAMIQEVADEQRATEEDIEPVITEGEAGAVAEREAKEGELDVREKQLDREEELNKREAKLLEERKRLEEERLELERPTEKEVVEAQERKAKEPELAEREQVRKESEAGAGQFELTREEGRQDTTGGLFEQPTKTFVQSMPDAGFTRIKSGAERQYKDEGGQGYPTFERDGVRVALSSGRTLGVERGAVIVYDSTDPADVIIQAVVVDKGDRQQGKAKGVMQDLVRMADDLGVTMYIEPTPIADKPMSADALRQFYGRLGFKPDASGKVMTREPGVKFQDVRPGRGAQKGGSGAEMFDQAEIENNRTPEYKSRTKLIEMSLKDFLALSEEGTADYKTEGVQKLVKDGKKFSSLPFLIIDRDGRVEGHEGRHRARALIDAGYTTMPVILRSANIRWSEQTDPKRFDYTEEWPKRLTAQSGAADQTFSIPFPVSREQADQPYDGDQAATFQDVRPAQTKTPAFKRWFGDSKVVDADGKPLVVYHGTARDITEFGGSKTGATYLSDRPEVSSYFATARTEDGSNVMPVYVSMQNPYVTEDMDYIEGVGYDKKEIARLKRLGYDGVSYSEPHFVDGKKLTRTDYVALYPEQIKSATGNRGTFDESANILQDIRPNRTQLGYYSALMDAVSGLKMASAPVSGWKDAIKGMINKGQIKAEEVEWTGLNDWLDLQEGKVSKEAVTEFLNNNGVRVEEVTLSGDGFYRDANGQRVFDDETGDFIGSQNQGVKYENYTLPGGENYREVLLTLPVKRLSEDEARKVLGAKPDAKLSEADISYASRKAVDEYRSPHWDQPNVLAHIRVNDRVDAEGKRVLFVEEIQSDWGQQGKRQGFDTEYKPQVKPGEYAEFVKTLKEKAAAHAVATAGVAPKTAELMVEGLGHDTLADMVGLRPQLDDLLRRQIQDFNAQQRGTNKSVPSAPFVTKTEGWLNLALKRIITMAAEGGYDRVAFVNGAQSADRYDLSQQVDRISYEPTNKGYYINVIAGGQNVKNGDFTVSELEDIVGKEIVQKMESGAGDTVVSPEEPDYEYLKDIRELSGEGLKVGGEGMKTFYDKIVPNAVKALLKKVGGDQLGKVDISDDKVFRQGSLLATRANNGDWIVYDNTADSPEVGRFKTREKAEEFIGYEPRPQPGFDITDKMREAVAAGLPYFQRMKPATAYPEEVKRSPSFKRRVTQLKKDLDAGKITDDQFVNEVDFAIKQAEQAAEAKRGAERTRGADFIRQKLLEAKRRGQISVEAVDMAEWFITNNEQLVDDLGVSIVSPKEEGVAGQYVPFSRVMVLLKEAGADTTVIHEIMHHLERMMPQKVQQGIRTAWARRFAKEQKKATGNNAKYLQKLFDFHFGDGLLSDYNAAMQMIKDGKVDYKLYQFANPSEFWAVNASDIVQGRFDGVRGGVLQRLKTWLKELGQRIKGTFGFDSDAEIIKALNSLSKGDGKFVSQQMLGEADTYMSVGQNILGQRVLGSWTDPTDTKLMGEIGKDDVIYALQDKQIDTKRVIEAITSTAGKIVNRWNPYLQEELYHGRTAKQTKDFLTGELRPLMQQMNKDGLSLADLEKYLHNRHAEDYNKQVAKVNPDNPDMQDGGSGIPTQQARDYLASLSPEDKKKYERLAKMVDGITKGTRQILVDNGLEAFDTIASWETAFPNYVPLHREEVDFQYTTSATGTGKGFDVRGPFSRSAMGSKRKVVDIIANIAMQRERAIIKSQKNRVATALYGLAIQNPNPGFWLAVNPVAERIPEAAIDELRAMGIDESAIEFLMKEPRQKAIDPKKNEVIERINTVLRNNDNVLSARVNGENRYVFFNPNNDRAARMAKALKNLDADQLGRGLKLVGGITRWMAAVNTQYNPIFGIYNFLRDNMSGALQLTNTPLAGKQGQVAAGVAPALKAIYSSLRKERKGEKGGSEWAKLWDDFQKAGGQTGFRDMFSRSQERTEALQKELTQMSQGKLRSFGRETLGWLSDFNDSMENAVRLSAYKTALDSGMSKEEAASLAKNLTVNFNRKGQVATQAGALYAFFNAAVQGTARLAQTLRGPAGRKIVVGGLMLGGIQALMLAAAGFDDEEPPEFVRERNFIIPIGGGKYIAVPYPLGYNVIPNTSRVITQWWLSGFKNTPERIANLTGSILEAFNPLGNAGWSVQTIAPTVADPLVALAENKDWTGKPIAREDFSGLDPTPGYTRSRDSANWLSVKIAEYLNYASGGTKYQPGYISPTADQLEYLVGQVTGGLGRETLKAAETVEKTITGEELPPYKIPLAGRFYGETQSAAAESNRFYKNLEMINKHENEIKGRRENREPVAEYLRDNPEARLASKARSVYSDIKKLKERKDALIERKASKDSIKAVENQITRRMKQLNDQVKNMQK